MEGKSRHVVVSVQEQILILRSYLKNGNDWRQVYREVIHGEGGLPLAAQLLYRDNSYDQIKKRISSQVQKLTSKREDLIENEELRSLVASIRGKTFKNQPLAGEKMKDTGETGNKGKKGKRKAPSSSIECAGEKIFKLAGMRFATVGRYHDQVLVGIREFYDDDGELKHGKTGISLTLEQWNRLKDWMNEIDDVMKYY